MASRVFDVSQLDNFARNLGRCAEDFSRKKKQFLRKEGTKLRGKTAAKARARVGRQTGGYHASIKRGKPYRFRDNDTLAVRVYSASPHAHLIEDGHRIVTPGGREVGFAPGLHVFETAGKEFASQYQSDLDDLLDEAVRRL